MTHESLSHPLPFSLTSGAVVGFEQQIVDQLPALVRSGRIAPGAPLPPARALASELMVSPATVRRAYQRMEKNGLILRESGNRPIVVHDIEQVVRRQALDRSRGELTQAILNVRRLTPGGCTELASEADQLRRAVEIDQARAMQRSLLPASSPVHSGIDIAVSMCTAFEVGGDYYDFLEPPHGGLRVVVGDATGHGIAAGIMAAMTKACLASINERCPAAMMRKANHVLRSVHGRRVLMALCIVDIEDGRVTVCSAGMPPVFVMRTTRGVIEEISLPSLPLGSGLAQSFPSRTVEFNLGDALVAVSDGLPELQDAGEQVLGFERLRACLHSTMTKSADSIVNSLTTLAASWSGERPPDDDLTVLAVKSVGEKQP